MTAVQNYPFALIMLFLASGVICFVLSGRIAKWYCLVLCGVGTVMMAMTLRYVLAAGESYVYLMGHFPSPWGNELRIGPFEALMAALFCAIALFSIMGGMEHILEDCEERKVNLYFASFCLLMSSMLALIFTNDLFTAYVFIEINTITACALVMLNYRNGGALIATTRYLIMSLLGSGLFLIAVILLYDLTGHLLMEPLGAAVETLRMTGGYLFPLTVIVGLLSVGLGIKSAIFPFHTWLPDAHANATSASSALLSGLVLKAYVILLIKLIYRVMSMESHAVSFAADMLFVFGVLAMIIGSVLAMGEQDLKRMLAYSSVAQVGYIYAGIGLGTTAGMIAAGTQIVTHAITKPMLFCAAGGFMGVSGGSRRISDLRGAAWRDPLSGVAFFVGALSMIGIPLFGGFATKLQLTLASIALPGWKAWLSIAAIVLSTVLNAIYYLKTTAALYSKDGTSPYDELRVTYRTLYRALYVIAILAFIILNIWQGIGSGTFTGIIREGLSLLG